MYKIKDYIKENDSNIMVRINNNPSETDPLVNEIYRGDLGKIPEKYYDIEVLSVGEVIASSGDSKGLFEFRVDIKWYFLLNVVA